MYGRQACYVHPYTMYTPICGKGFKTHGEGKVISGPKNNDLKKKNFYFYLFNFLVPTITVSYMGPVHKHFWSHWYSCFGFWALLISMDCNLRQTMYEPQPWLLNFSDWMGNWLSYVTHHGQKTKILKGRNFHMTNISLPNATK